MKEPFRNWLHTFDYLKEQVRNTIFDVLIAGCGSYGMPIAHYAKQIGRAGIQAGSYTQVMFGIKGKRWDGGTLSKIWNDHWVWPRDDETPPDCGNLEGGAYWKP